MNKTEQPKHLFHVEQDGGIYPRAVTRGSAVVEIPAGVYRPCVHSEMGFYLKPENEFKLPPRVYGDVSKHVDRFLRSYELNDRNLGVMLVGDSGSGKTLTLKTLVQKGVELGIPTILVDTPYHGAALMQFFGTITQNCIVAFDEYDKTYGGPKGVEMEAQTTMLQLLDGTSACSKKLFIFSANNERLISEYMKDRPSRIRYTLKFNRLGIKTVIEYVNANLKDRTEEHLRAFIHMALSDGFDVAEPSHNAKESNGINFDSMRELINEMNQFGGTLNDSLAIMMDNGRTSYCCFSVAVYDGNVLVTEGSGRGTHTGAYLTTDNYTIEVKYAGKELIPATMDGEKVMMAEYEITAPKIVTLTKADFLQFGSEVDLVEFEKDGLRFVCRYVDHKAYCNLASKVERDITSAGQYLQNPAGQHRSGFKTLTQMHREQFNPFGGKEKIPY